MTNNLLIGILPIAPLLLYIVAIAAIVLCFTRKLPFFASLFLTTGSVVAAFMSNILYVKLAYQENMVKLVVNSSIDDMKTIVQELSGSGFNADMALAFSDSLEALKSLYLLLFPAIVICTLLILAYVIYYIIKIIVRAFKRDVSFIPSFSELKMGKVSAIALGVSLLGYLIGFSYEFSAAFINVTLCLAVVFAFCGLSLIDYILRMRVPYTLLRLLIYFGGYVIISIIAPYILYGLVILGVADSIFNLRRKVASGGVL